MSIRENTVQGFKASAVAAGLKKDKSLDLALIFSERESAAAGVFTNNKVKAAPVIISREHVLNGSARAIVANAGNANACTGKTGLDDARRTTGLLAEQLGIQPDEVLVASTGVIGEPLNINAISGAVPSLVKALSPDGMLLAARAIMTTDSFPKMSYFYGRAGGQPYRILGISKGAGMIMPNMATMLSFILTDIRVDSRDLKRALLSSVETTFNRITVDGDTSTNDMVLVMANGMAGNRALSEAGYRDFKKGLETVMGELAHMMVRDGEGATKLITIEIKGALSSSDAIKAARTVANSCLVKTAFYGKDPNWGRIMAALGRADIEMKEESVDIWVDDVQIVAGGLGKGAEAEKRAAEIMAGEEFTLTIDLHLGDYQDRIITCDLTHEYVTINADYRT
ncbi:MAG: bifunctional glutamate N-acetyltransferase/amino-acid acetyltransferase ArgJ [Deltaproteobacteria bacterium]|nr:bifunctional glutamate N-acetyltransferase/amino-acid acetyltransferase ArgJ [Deltaproteobacteria bacterium]MBW1737795.1 bifunctional glutamate N-acetyltransferase/amino-acid acetyltransferase ArgJ [Deltaproteobacteria bacterium]MBW1910928.1 bifunctional glutamate N-acetyltransferase/amino-acid acetyltransferase ArgJ [Deltaproteobacteria bacterium]MBW2034993.1 bifunctional glutamate N-acetyltransferase/amino-acid acetyltransferase ArgJ [Deltaproteobacteria bacterium]MBW2115280.1 bifunctional